MYKLHIVSRCKNKALLTTRRILDKYAIRVSDTTWNCEITEKGLRNLIGHLKSQARRNSAIAIYLIKNNKINLFCIIGKRELFGKDGACPIATHSSVKDFYKDYNYMNMPIYQKILEYIGYSHDIGKISYEFQDMIKKEKIVKNSFHHSLLSGIFLLFNNYNELISFIDERIKEKTNFKNFRKEFKKEKIKKAKNNDLMLFYLISSHHFLFGYDLSVNVFSYPHVNIDDEDDEKFFKYIKRLRKDITGKEAKNLLEKALNLKKDLINYLDVENFNIQNGDFLYLRNCLMIADHNISANLISYNNDSKTLMAKSKSFGEQTLKNHLFGVSKMSKKICTEFLNLKNRLPSLYKNELLKPMVQARGNFKWQNDCLKLLEDSLENNDCPSLVIINSKTGSGKTLMALKSNIAMSKDDGLRLNVALDLRTLTMQTSKKYKEYLDIEDENIATLIGEKNSIILDEIINEDEAIENDLNDINDILIVNGINSQIPKMFEQELRFNNHKKLLSTPICISTIDFLISSRDWTRSKHILSQLRLSTSDLIIDEIDAYSKEDTNSILRVVYLLGYYRRNLTVTTATPSRALVEKIHYYYQKGISDSQNVYHNNIQDVKKINYFYLSDLGSKFIQTNNYKESLSTYTSLQNSNEKKSKKEKREKHKIEIISCDSVENIDDYKQLMVEKSLKLHEFNNEESEGIRCSFGLIRCETIKFGYEICKKIEELESYYNEKGIEFNLVFYHSRHLLPMRTYIEKLLDESLNRKVNKIKDTKIGQIALKKALQKNNKVKDVITIVVSTQVEEVGRDHDFDWSMIEPTSTRSIIQIMGRVSRHREIFPDNPNVNIMEFPSIAFEDRDSNSYYRNLNSKKGIFDLLTNKYNINNFTIINNSDKLEMPQKEDEELESCINNQTQNLCDSNTSWYISTNKNYIAWRKSFNNTEPYCYKLDNMKLARIDVNAKNQKEIVVVDLDNFEFAKASNIYLINDNNINSIFNENISMIKGKFKNKTNDEISMDFLKIDIPKRNKIFFSKCLGAI